MKLLFVESDNPSEYNCSWWRCASPVRALLQAGETAGLIRIEEWGQQTEMAKKLTEESDIVFVQRNLFGNIIESIVEWRAKGKRIVIDLDDAYGLMEEGTGSPSFEFWINARVKLDDGSYQLMNPKPFEYLKWGVKLAGAVSSPSKVICDDWSAYAKTHWFPNFIDQDLYKRHQVHHPEGKIFIGWGGSATHLQSWKMSGVAEAMAQIITEFPEVQLMLLGDPRVQKIIKVPPSRKIVLGWCPHSMFSERLSRIDIGIAPLAGEYDRRRSWLKSLEYTTMGIPWIGTDWEPNRDLAPNTGLLVENTPEEWYKGLKFYVTHLKEMQWAATENMKIAQEYTIQNNVPTLLKIFERML